MSAAQIEKQRSKELYLLSAEDKMITPDAQRAMPKRAGSKVVETKGSHAVYASLPEAVASRARHAVPV